MLKQDTIDGVRLKAMFLSAASYLDSNKQAVNALNVFPVPDGDTGTNMSLTMLSAAREIMALSDNSVTQVVDALSRGSLKGARGNSGVILSQLFRGFARKLKGEESITTVKYAEAMKAGVETAYKAVMKPVEGTILTVARVSADHAMSIAPKKTDFKEFFSELLRVAKSTLDKTPDLLPVLKQAGVVDSGGMGLLYIMMGCSHGLEDDNDSDLTIDGLDEYKGTPDLEPDAIESIEFGYCTEFFIKNIHSYITDEDIDKLKDKLDKLGDSVVVVGDRELIKVHFHTNMPGKGLQLGLRFGELSSIKIDNMREQHRHVNPMEDESAAKEPEKAFGVVSVAMGDGIASIFRDLSVDAIIEGGQTMNPSIEDILKAVEGINAREIFILPNNSNIILSARQAAEISEKKIHVIPTRTIPQGMAAMLNYNPDADTEVNVRSMTAAIDSVKSGQVTYAVRRSNFDGISIEEGDIMGLCDGRIVTTGKSINAVTRDLIDKMLEDGGELVTILYGKDVTEESAIELADMADDRHIDVDFEVLPGGQPLYYYILSVE